MSALASDPKAIVARFFAAFSAGDIATVLAMMDDEADWWVSGSVDGFSGRHAKAAFGELLAGVKDIYRGGALRVTPSSMIAEGDNVAVEAEGWAELFNGRIYNSRYHFRVELRGDKILHVREYMDTLHAQQIFFEA